MNEQATTVRTVARSTAGEPAPWRDGLPSLDLVSLAAAYAAGVLTPSRLVEALLARLDEADPAIWITRAAAPDLRARAAALEAAGPDGLPLYGVPFAVKDNIDVAGLPTTAACPAFAAMAEVTAPVVQALLDAGAICLGKTNLDQFATGLVGVRSPYGVPRNAINPDLVPGGSSSGSAVAVAAGLASFALGTDTAGSGRVPAAFNNIVGLKPTRGLLSIRGVVPACRTLDCVSILALTAGDAAAVLEVAARYDEADPFARPWPADVPAHLPGGFRFGVPAADQLSFFGNEAARRAYDAAVARLALLGGRPVAVDFTPFGETAELLYGGPWVAERYAVAEALLARAPDALLPVTRTIIEGARRFSAVDAFRAQYRLAELRRAAEATWRACDVLLLPTTGTAFTRAELEADPIGCNSALGVYTNFVNLLDLAALALPNGFEEGRPAAAPVPVGITLVAPAFADRALARLGAAWQREGGWTLGATGHALPDAAAEPAATSVADGIDLIVFGAHMTGLPLARELEAAGARPLGPVRTAAEYRMYLLDQFAPPRPGLVRVASGGAALEGEAWSVPAAALGRFVAGIAAPLSIGTVALADGRACPGFLCEGAGAEGRRDITGFGGWRRFLAAG